MLECQTARGVIFAVKSVAVGKEGTHCVGDDSITRVETPRFHGRTSSNDEWLSEFQASWVTGGSPRAEAYFDRYPELGELPEASLRLIYEEVCQRGSRGETVELGELIVRFPQWQTELRSLLADRSDSYVHRDSFVSETGFASF